MTEIIKSNPKKKELVIMLEIASRKNNARIWDVLAEQVNQANRKRREMNLGRLNTLASDKTLVTACKILSHGEVTNKIIVAAASYTPAAKKKIESKGGQLMTFEEIIKQNPEGKNLVIVK